MKLSTSELSVFGLGDWTHNDKERIPYWYRESIRPAHRDSATVLLMSYGAIKEFDMVYDPPPIPDGAFYPIFCESLDRLEKLYDQAQIGRPYIYDIEEAKVYVDQFLIRMNQLTPFT